MLLLTKLNKTLFGYFDPDFVFKRMKINIFRGDLTDILAIKEPLVAVFMSRTGEEGQRCPRPAPGFKLTVFDVNGTTRMFCKYRINYRSTF